MVTSQCYPLVSPGQGDCGTAKFGELLVPLCQPDCGLAEGRRAAASLHQWVSLQTVDEGHLGVPLGPFCLGGIEGRQGKHLFPQLVGMGGGKAHARIRIS